MKIDTKDNRIIELLEENGRRPHNEIADNLDISEGTVRNRMKKLIDNGLLKIKALVNPNKLTEKQLIYILVTLEATKR